MSDREIEDRYIVIKKSDLDQRERQALDRIFYTHQIRTREAIVVEADWPIYDDVCQMVKSLPCVEPIKLCPEGWQCVPIEPTLAMIAAMGWDGDEDLAIGHGSISEKYAEDFKLALSAAPAPGDT